MNYYDILEIDKNSSTDQIKKHYYQLAKKYHPDKNNSINSEKFKVLSEAYSVLSNPKKRYLYDLELLLKQYNIINDKFNFHFSDDELILLHSYYSKIINSTEIKFIKLLYHSFPENIKSKINYKFNSPPQNKNYKNNFKCISTQNIKYIDISQLNNNYFICLKRNLKDVFLTICKQIIIKTKYYSYHLFITHSDYQIKIFNSNNSSLIINIETENNKYHIDGNNLYYHSKINLYEYYFLNKISFQLPNNTIYSFEKNKLKTHILSNFGLKDIFTNQRGNLYIYIDLELDNPNIHKYKKLLYEIFS